MSQGGRDWFDCMTTSLELPNHRTLGESAEWTRDRLLPKAFEGHTLHLRTEEWLPMHRGRSLHLSSESGDGVLPPGGGIEDSRWVSDGRVLAGHLRSTAGHRVQMALNPKEWGSTHKGSPESPHSRNSAS